VVEDFLPPPSELVLKEDLEKVTIALSKSSVEFFRREARRNGTQYQRMIRALLDKYVQINAPSKFAMQRTRER
jgi:predicted DNA binding CopG/RHH family protein